MQLRNLRWKSVGLLAAVIVLVFFFSEKFAGNRSVWKNLAAVAVRPVRLEPHPLQDHAPPAIARRGRPAEGLQMRGSRQEIAESLRRFFQREVVTEELKLEQQRYGVNYWDPEKGGVELAKIRGERLALIVRLNAELNQILNDLAPDESGEPVVLSAIFDDEHPGPRLENVTVAHREKFEALLSAEAIGTEAFDRGAILALAREAFSAEEFARYLRWNGADVASLRNELVGFRASESEFAEILLWRKSVDAGGSETAETLEAELTLEDRIGSTRFMALLQWQDPERQTATQDLYRIGLPVELAEWLANFRRQGRQEIQKLWSDPLLPTDAKEVRVAQLQRSYRATLAATLARPESFSTTTDLMP